MKSNTIVGCLAGGVALVVLVGLAGAVAYFAMHEDEFAEELTMPGTGGGFSTSSLGSWNGQTTLECGGNDAATIRGVSAVLAQGPAIRASVNCRLELEDVSLTAPVVIEASGNAHVTVRGGALAGTSELAVASGNARVTFVGAQTTGTSRVSGNARVEGAQ